VFSTGVNTGLAVEADLFQSSFITPDAVVRSTGTNVIKMTGWVAFPGGGLQLSWTGCTGAAPYITLNNAKVSYLPKRRKADVQVLFWHARLQGLKV
jgi:hypothetical protein